MKTPHRPILFVLSTVFCLLFSSLMTVAAETSGEQAKAVLITGASSGIGKRTAELLASKGYIVYAGARKEADLDALNKIENITGVKLDVTVQGDIDSALAYISSTGTGLYGIVNNAGVINLGAMIEVDEGDLEFLFDVNIYGPYRITKAFAPLVIASKGRIVNISSISGVLSGPLFGAYSMSKHALESYTDTLAGEMAKFGVNVAAVEPGNFASMIGATAKKRAEKSGQLSAKSLYQDEMNRMFSGVGNRADMADPIAVAEAVEHALFNASPKARYMVVPNQVEAAVTIQKVIREMVELNEDQAHSYDRDALIKMLDQALHTL